MPEHLGLPLYGQEMERHSELEVKSTSSRHIGVGEIHLSWDAASDGLASGGGLIPSEFLEAESRTLPIPLFPSWRSCDTKDTASIYGDNAIS